MKNLKAKSSSVIQADDQKVVVQELNIVSANRSTSDIGDFRTALNGAERTWDPNRVLLYDLYNSILIDGHLSGVISKRIDFVSNKEVFFENSKMIRVEEMDKFIQSVAFDNIVRTIMETKFWGVSGFEFIPGFDVKFKEIPRKHIDPKNKKITYEQSGGDGIYYEGVSNLWVIGNENDLGILLKCTPQAIYKRGVLGDWAQFIELFGQPIRVIYYDAYDEKTKMELRQLLDESGSSLALMVPKQAQFEMMDGKESNANGELQERFIKQCNSEMSIIVLGNTESTSSSSSSGYAQSKVHAQQQLEITKGDLRYVQGMLNSPEFIAILRSYGLPVNDGRFRFSKDINLEELRIRADIDSTVYKFMDREISEVDHDYVYRTYGIPKPSNYDELIKKRKVENSADAFSHNSHLSGIKLNHEYTGLAGWLMDRKEKFWENFEKLFQ